MIPRGCVEPEPPGALFKGSVDPLGTFAGEATDHRLLMVGKFGAHPWRNAIMKRLGVGRSFDPSEPPSLDIGNSRTCDGLKALAIIGAWTFVKCLGLPARRLNQEMGAGLGATARNLSLDQECKVVGQLYCDDGRHPRLLSHKDG